MSFEPLRASTARVVIRSALYGFLTKLATALNITASEVREIVLVVLADEMVPVAPVHTDAPPPPDIF